MQTSLTNLITVKRGHGRTRSLLISLAILAAGLMAGCELQQNLVTIDPPTADWPLVARIAGASLDIGDESYDNKRLLDEFVDQNVNVIEADSRLSEYLSEEDFDKELELMTHFTAMAHERNIKVVWYYPVLEVITTNGETLERSMFKDHPDWVQLGIDNTDPAKNPPNVFYGSKVFWVDPGAESAWMDPHTPYRQYFIERVKKIAVSGVDGIWMDVPLYNDIVGRWASQHPASRAAFKADTGLDAPTPVNLSDPEDPPYYDLDAKDPAVKKWIHWRHQVIDELLKEVYTEARFVNPDFQVIVETVTMDYNASLLEGLDGSFTGPLEGFWHVWEVDVLSDKNAMQNAIANDWYGLIAMYKFGRGADRGRAAWAFTYGLEPDDAEAVLFQAVVAQVNPYELKIPQMTTTVGHEYRKRVFGFLKDNEDDIYRSNSAARVAIVHSSASRDYLDALCVTGEEGVCGVSLFSSWKAPDPKMAWWTDSPGDSVDEAHYMSDYRGTVKALTNLHVPFDIQPSRLMTPEILDLYDVIYLPSFAAASDKEVDLIEDFVRDGGTAYISGKAAVTMKEDGSVRTTLPEYSAAPESGCIEVALGNGRIIRCTGKPGQMWLTDEIQTALTDMASPLEFMTAQIETTAPGGISLDLYSRENRLIVQAMNHSGADGTWSVKPQIFDISVNTGGKTVTSVKSASARQDGTSSVKFTQSGDVVTFTGKVQIHTMWMIELQ